MEPTAWTGPEEDAYDLLPEPDTDTNDTPDEWEEDCPYCEGSEKGCEECDYTGSYE